MPKLLEPLSHDENEVNDFFDPGAIIDDLISNDLRPEKKKLLVDDRDLPRAPNFITWCTDKRFLYTTPHPPFARHIQVGTQLFNEACPDCSDPKLLNNMFAESVNELRDRISFLEFGVCPKCKKTRLDLYNEKKIKLHNELCACWGQRAGKTVFMGSMVSTYQVHKFLCLEDPGRIFGLIPKTPMYLFFTAVTAKQALDTLWIWFSSAIEESPWFNNLHSLLDYYEQRLGTELYSIGKTYYKYKHKNIQCKYVAPNKKSIRGKTNFLTGIDEWGWFDHEADSKKITINGEEINIALIRGLITLRSAHLKLFKAGHYDLPTAISGNVSSPADINDNIMRRLRKAKSMTSILASHYSTWEVNVNLPYESLEDEFKDDPIKASRDLGAQPPIASNPFIENKKLVEKMAVGSSICKYQLQDFTDGFGDRSVFIKLIDIVPEKAIPRIITIDTGRSNNSFAILMGHLEIIDAHEIFKTDLTIECQPKTVDGDKAPINFAKMFSECILELCKQFNVVLVAYDRWQSLHQIDELRKNDINAQCYSLTWADFCSIKAKFYDGMIELLKGEVPLKSLWESSEIELLQRKHSSFHLLVQLLTVREIGLKVEKPINGTDDLFRCLWLAAAFVFDDDYKKLFTNNGVSKQTSRMSSNFLVKAFGQSSALSSPTGSLDSSKFKNIVSVKPRGF